MTGVQTCALPIWWPSQSEQCTPSCCLEKDVCKAHGSSTRSPDLNPIQKKKNITFETYEELSERVMTTFKNLNENFIDNTIASMNNRIDTIIRNKGSRKEILMQLIFHENGKKKTCRRIPLTLNIVSDVAMFGVTFWPDMYTIN